MPSSARNRRKPAPVQQTDAADRSLDPAAREFEFSALDFERVRKLIYQHAGIALNDSKSNMVYSRLARRLRARGVRRFEDYLRLLETDHLGEREAFINSLTTNLTAFFRESHHFPILAERIKAVARQREAVLWCAAASTGEEPYSMAIAAMEALTSMTPRVRILASDIDTHVLAHASQGLYEASAVAKLDPDRLRRYFLRRTGADGDCYQVRPEVQALVTFRRINLLDGAWPVRGPLDAIFCRNVMIYFDKPTQRRVVERFVPLLAPGGLLFTGHSENLAYVRELVEPCGRTVYARVRSAGRPTE
jgi:chemotaxis protein methyltransferase CheR